MLRPLLGAAATALVLVASIVSACKTDASSGGPPCKGADADQTCYDCQSGKCSDAFGQVESACGDFLACEAQCTCSDISCLEACSAKITGDCATANDALEQCAKSSCAGECSKATPDGGTTAPSCQKLAVCCPTLPANAVDGCNTVVHADNDSICSQQLANYQSATYCGESTGACEKLATCCAAITDPDVQMGCNMVAQGGVDNTCAAELGGFEAGGLCP